MYVTLQEVRGIKLYKYIHARISKNKTDVNVTMQEVSKNQTM